MTRQEVSKLEIRINLVTLWSVIVAIAIGSYVVATSYSDIKWELKLMKDEVKTIKEELRNNK